MTSSSTPVARFVWMMQQLCMRIGTGRMMTQVALVGVLCVRFQRWGRHFADLVARYEAGTLRPSQAGRTWPARKKPGAREAEEETGADAPLVTPLGRAALSRIVQPHGWLVAMAPETREFRAHVSEFLHRPEVFAMITQAPQFRRVLRPLLHALGLATTEFPMLDLPRRPCRKPAPAGPTASDPAPRDPAHLDPAPIARASATTEAADPQLAFPAFALTPPEGRAARRKLGLSGVRVRRPRYA